VKRSITGYRIGLAVIGVLALVVFAIVLDRAGAHRQDTQTGETVNGIADKLNNYIDDKQKVPSSLAAAGIKNIPANVSYRKRTKDIYEFCVNYQASTNGFNLSGAAQNFLINGNLAGNADSGYSSGYSQLFIDPIHHQGENCQTVDTGITSNNTTTQTTTQQSPFVQNSDKSYTVCGVHTNYYDGTGHVNTDITASSISLSATDYPYVGARLLFIVSSGSQFFDEQCKSLQKSDIQPGDTVSVFDITPGNTPAISIFLKRSF
jgi:hypothetical protein